MTDGFNGKQYQINKIRAFQFFPKFILQSYTTCIISIFLKRMDDVRLVASRMIKYQGSQGKNGTNEMRRLETSRLC